MSSACPHVRAKISKFHNVCVDLYYKSTIKYDNEAEVADRVRLLSGSGDKTSRLRDIDKGSCLRATAAMAIPLGK